MSLRDSGIIQYKGDMEMLMISINAIKNANHWCKLKAYNIWKNLEGDSLSFIINIFVEGITNCLQVVLYSLYIHRAIFHIRLEAGHHRYIIIDGQNVKLRNLKYNKAENFSSIFSDVKGSISEAVCSKFRLEHSKYRTSITTVICQHQIKLQRQ